MAINQPNRTQPLSKVVSTTPLSDLYTDDRAGSLSELVGTSINIYRVERFRSETYSSDGFRLVLRTTLNGIETSGDLLFTGFAKPVMRVVAVLLEGPDAILRECDPPISCTVVQQGNTYGLK
jgi:hypothetical protein